jgi:hypothetical protein
MGLGFCISNTNRLFEFELATCISHGLTMRTQGVLNILASQDVIVHKLYPVLVDHVVLPLSFRLLSEVAARVSHQWSNPQLRHLATKTSYVCV